MDDAAHMVDEGAERRGLPPRLGVEVDRLDPKRARLWLRMSLMMRGTSHFCLCRDDTAHCMSFRWKQRRQLRKLRLGFDCRGFGIQVDRKVQQHL